MIEEISKAGGIVFESFFRIAKSTKNLRERIAEKYAHELGVIERDNSIIGPDYGYTSTGIIFERGLESLQDALPHVTFRPAKLEKDIAIGCDLDSFIRILNTNGSTFEKMDECIMPDFITGGFVGLHPHMRPLHG